MPVITRLQLRHDTAANWTAINPVLALGEAGVETDTNKLKVGNGAALWTSLAYVAGAGGGGGGGGDMLAANNLSDLINKATSRINLGVAIGTDVQAWDQDLTYIAGITRNKGDMIVGDAASWNKVPVGSNGFALIADSAQTTGVRWGPVTSTETGSVPTARTLTTIAPLTGGGDLSANRTLGVNTFGAAQPGVVPLSGGGTTNFLRADGSWATPPGGGAQAGHASFNFNASITEPPLGNQIRLNNATQTVATKMWVSKTDTDGLDVSIGLAKVLATHQIYIQDFDDATKWVKYAVTADGIDKGSYYEFAVTFLAGPANVPAQKCEMQPIAPGTVGVPSGGTTGQVLSKVTNADYNVGWSTVSGGGGSGDMLLGTAQTVTGAKTFGAPGDTQKLKIAGITSGSVTLDAQSIASGVLVLPNGTDVLIAATATQGLSNKTLNSCTINSPTGLTKTDVGLSNVDNTSDATKNAAAVTLTNKTLTNPVLVNGVGGVTFQVPTPVSTGILQFPNGGQGWVTCRDTVDVLTNKSIALGSNTVTGTLAQLNTAITDGDLVANGGGVATIRSLSQATYDAIGTKDPNTLYVIV